MVDSGSFQLGAQHAQLEAVNAWQDKYGPIIDRIALTLAERKGERRVVLWLAAATSAAVSAIGAFVGKHN